MAGERSWIAVAVLGGAMVLVAVLAIAGVFGGGDDDSTTVVDDFGAAEAPEATSPTKSQPRVKRIEVGGTPDVISVGAGYVWVGDTQAGTMKRIHPESERPIAVEPAGFPTDISAGVSAAWLALPDRGAVQAVTVKGPADPIKVSQFPFQIAAGEGGAWAMSQNSVERITASGPDGDLDGPPIKLGGDGSGIDAEYGHVWAIRDNRDVVRLNPEGDLSFEQTAEVRGAFGITSGESAVWVLGANGRLTRLDPISGEPAGDPVQTGRGTDVAAGLGYVWVTSDNGTVLRFDPETGAEVGVPIKVGRDPIAVAAGEGAAWIAASGDGSVYKITP
jgi:DNA-binding beta-propeller fold protein YncE